MVLSGGRINFAGAKFSGSTSSFDRAIFSGGSLYLSRAVFPGGGIQFANATFYAGAIMFGHATFSRGEVDMSLALLQPAGPELEGPPDGPVAGLKLHRPGRRAADKLVVRNASLVG
ncbi:hypothetical protein [Kribbella catacumbae]|uniref:hypothetical protein n=1 Tax=Kribbella catacumbae TaxID=460086 RepID=UPI0003715A5C|nr:hypothetical protein [Kribbella catacumbae]